MSVVPKLKNEYPNSKIHWITKERYADMVGFCRGVDKVWSFNSNKGILGLILFSLNLRRQGYDLVYDAHSNIRSFILTFFLFFSYKKLIRRKKFRFKRFILFNLQKNLFPKRYKATESYMQPLIKHFYINDLSFLRVEFDFQKSISKKISHIIRFKEYVVLAPSSNWKKKRWPIKKWNNLIEKLPKINFVILGGPKDLFCQDFEKLYPDNTQNLCGKLNLVESFYAIKMAKLIISADTGMIHMADILHQKGILLIGPTAFGETTGINIEVLKSNLPCMPCSKDGSGGCSSDVFQKCMQEISVNSVVSTIHNNLKINV